MTTQHTPGPWNYVQIGTQIWASSVGGCRMEKATHLIADVRGWGHIQYLPNGSEVQDANGLLIAAAPELLAALEKALPHIDCNTHSGYAAREAVRAAIKKSTGAA